MVLVPYLAIDTVNFLSDPGRPESFFPYEENSCGLLRLYRKNLKNLVQKLEPAQDHALRDWFLADFLCLSLRLLKFLRRCFAQFCRVAIAWCICTLQVQG